MQRDTPHPWAPIRGTADTVNGHLLQQNDTIRRVDTIIVNIMKNGEQCRTMVSIKYIFTHLKIHIFVYMYTHPIGGTPVLSNTAAEPRCYTPASSTDALVMIRIIFVDDMLLHLVNDHHRYGRTWCMLLNEDSACMRPFQGTDSMLFYKDFFVYQQGYHR